MPRSRDAETGSAVHRPARILKPVMYGGPPVNVGELEQRVNAIAGALGVAPRRARLLVSSIVVTQMLPAGAFVKGGIGVKLRLGETGTRATRDVDVVARDRERFLAGLAERLEVGWGTVPPSHKALKMDPAAPPRLAFDGWVRPHPKATPDGIPPAYVMEPYAVTLRFMTKPWAAVPVEVSHDELDGALLAGEAREVAEEVVFVGAVLGFGKLTPVPLISVEQQIAQKIHAVTRPESRRGHDLVDLQLLWHVETDGGQGIDLPLLAQLCRRTFDYRLTHSWPPAVVLPERLASAYADACAEAGSGAGDRLALTFDEAATWLRDRVIEIDAVASPSE